MNASAENLETLPPFLKNALKTEHMFLLLFEFLPEKTFTYPHRITHARGFPMPYASKPIVRRRFKSNRFRPSNTNAGCCMFLKIFS